MQLDGSFNLFNIPVGKTFGVILTPLYYKTFQIVRPKQVTSCCINASKKKLFFDQVRKTNLSDERHGKR